MSEELLDVVLSDLARQATEVFERDGRIPGTMWALGEDLAIFARPSGPDANDLTPGALAALHRVIADHVKAVFFGRIDETYTKEMKEGDPTLDTPGDLARIADSDPEVHTAIVVEGAMLNSEPGQLVIRVLTVDDEGRAVWTEAHHDLDVDHLTLTTLAKALPVPETLSEQIADLNDLEYLARSLHHELSVVTRDPQ
jgi:hypothetical protein